MTIATFNDLTAAVADWIARDDLTARIPEFITLAEAKLNRSLRCQEMETRSYATVSITDAEPAFIALPTDFQTMRSVVLSSVTDKPRLQYLDDLKIKDYRSNIGDLTARPQYFGIFGTEMELVPRPDLAYVLEMTYRARLPALTNATQTNWLLTRAPDVYLYGAMLEAAPYMQDDKRIPVWLAGFQNAIETLNTLTQDVVN